MQDLRLQHQVYLPSSIATLVRKDFRDNGLEGEGQRIGGRRSIGATGAVEVMAAA